jgi:hypothetical protein
VYSQPRLNVQASFLPPDLKASHPKFRSLCAVGARITAAEAASSNDSHLLDVMVAGCGFALEEDLKQRS